MRVLSLFDGISTGRLALEKAGIPVDVYYSSEIDKNAIAISKYHYPDIIRLGDVTKIDFTQYKDVDLIFSGSPCTDMSVANRNRKGIYGKESSLFFYFIKALEEIKPKYFLQENVASMRNADKQIITETLTSLYPDTHCYLIDSALVSGQSRKRYYWTNIQIDQPADKSIYLNDILEDYRNLEEFNGVLTDGCLKFDGTFRASNGKRICLENLGFPYCLKEVRTEQGKALRRAARIAGKGDTTPRTAECKMFVPRTDNKANCLTTSANADSIVVIPNEPLIVRKLLPIECDRLQTMGDDYTKYGVNEAGEIYTMTDSARYKALGNGWTCDVVTHILSGINAPVIKSVKRLF